jgi:hypothetical protein
VPPVIDVTPESPDTGAGVARSTVVPSPSCPTWFSPQHHAAPDEVIAQL